MAGIDCEMRHHGAPVQEEPLEEEFEVEQNRALALRVRLFGRTIFEVTVVTEERESA